MITVTIQAINSPLLQMEVLTKQPPTGSSYHHFITTNSFFRELKKYYNHALPQFIKKEKKQNTRWSLRTV